MICMGRKKMLKKDAKSVLLNLRIKPAELREYKRKADASGLTVSEWIRQALSK